MRRREFISLIGGAAAWPLAAQAQQLERMRRIGVLMAYGEGDAEGQSFTAAFVHGLQELGWTNGRNLRIDYRWAAGDVERMRALAKELVELNPTRSLPTPLRSPPRCSGRRRTISGRHGCRVRSSG